MSKTDFTFARPVGLVGGGPCPEADLAQVAPLVQTFVAADGGADALLRAGITPHVVIGDMDSASPAARAAFAGRIHHIPEQYSTDFDKALRHITAPIVYGLGLAGGRFDHELAVMNTLVRHADRPCVVLGAETLAVLCPPQLRLDLPPGSDFSLFPMRERRIASQGLVWPTEGLVFAPGGMVGTSNRVADGPVEITPDGPGVLVITPRAALAAVVAGVLAGGRWPGP